MSRRSARSTAKDNVSTAVPEIARKAARKGVPKDVPTGELQVVRKTVPKTVPKNATTNELPLHFLTDGALKEDATDAADAGEMIVSINDGTPPLRAPRSNACCCIVFAAFAVALAIAIVLVNTSNGGAEPVTCHKQTADVEHLKSTNLMLDKELETCKGGIERLKSANLVLDKELETCKGESERLQQNVTELTTENADLKAKVEQLNANPPMCTMPKDSGNTLMEYASNTAQAVRNTFSFTAPPLPELEEGEKSASVNITKTLKKKNGEVHSESYVRSVETSL